MYAIRSYYAAAADRYQRVLGQAGPAVTDGSLRLTVPALDFVILKAEQLAPSPVATPTLEGVAEGDTVAGLLGVRIDASELAGQALPQYQVLFEASINGGDFRTLVITSYSIHYTKLYDQARGRQA